MERYLLIKFNKDDYSTLVHSLNVVFQNIKISRLDEDEIYIYDIDPSSYQKDLLLSLFYDLGIKVKVLICYTISNYTRLMLNYINDNSITNLVDFIFDAIINKNDKIIKQTATIFDSVDYDLLLTIKEYISNDLNVLKTSKSLYLHRNTLNYRINKFINITSLDIRDFNNAYFFLLCLKCKEILDL